jgi:rare lipoprotein A
MLFRLYLIALIGLTFYASPAYANAYACSEEVERGVASWYGPGFEGALTKSEEIFDPSTMSAAHPSLPFGTMLKVMNMRNHRSVFVRVNDRGAFSKERVIDVSQAAAQQLGMVEDGVAAVAIFRCNQ